MPREEIKNSFNEGKLKTATEIADFSSTFVVSEELVKIYLDHLKHLDFSKDLRSQATAEKRRNGERGVLKSLYVIELDTHVKKTFPSIEEKKLKMKRLC